MHAHWLGDAIYQLILCCPLLLPSVFPSFRVFSNESALCIRWPKCWSFSFSISTSSEYSGLVSFRIDWFNLLAIQGNSQMSPPSPPFESISSLALSFMVRLSQLYMTTGKTTGLKEWCSPTWRDQETMTESCHGPSWTVFVFFFKLVFRNMKIMIKLKEMTFSEEKPGKGWAYFWRGNW